MRPLLAGTVVAAVLFSGCGGSASDAPAAATTPPVAPSQTSVAARTAVLVYQTWDGAPHLRVRQEDGTGDRLLADGSHPDWSPDGSQVAYEVDSQDIWVIGADGSNARRVFDCQDPCVIGDSAAWSPDGKRLAFTTADATDGQVPAGRIVAVDVSSGELSTLVETTGPDYPFYPRWAPDGGSLVFSIQRFATTGVDDCQTTGSAIATIDLTAAAPIPMRLTDFDMFADYPDWSPDGSTIVFTTYDLGVRDACTIDPTRSSDIFTMRADGGGLTQLTHNSNGTVVVRNGTATGPLSAQPTWTRDGMSIVFTRVEGSVWPGYQVWTMRPDGSGAAAFGIGAPIVGSHPRLAP